MTVHGYTKGGEQMLDTEQIISGGQFFVVTHFSTPIPFIFRPILTENEVKGNYFSYFVSGVYFMGYRNGNNNGAAIFIAKGFRKGRSVA